MIRALLVLLAAASCVCATGRVEHTADLVYVADANPKHTLDLFLPGDGKRSPLVVFVHGGAFMGGDRREYAALGNALAAQGYAVAIPSYRLYPETDAQGATNDIAASIAWLVKNAPPGRVDVTHIILAGHSAGGQIVAMLATHRRYLDGANVPPDTVRGAFVLAGAYDVRDLSDEPLDWQRIDDRIFGPTPEARARISPGIAFDAHPPKIVAVCGSRDDPGACPRAQYFVNALTTAGASASFVRAEGADHNALVRRFIDPSDALNRTFRTFVAERL